MEKHTRNTSEVSIDVETTDSSLSIENHIKKRNSVNIPAKDNIENKKRRRKVHSTSSIPDFVKHSNSSISIRPKAIDQSSWTQDEFELFKKWEIEALGRSQVHDKIANRYAKKNKWLRFASGMISTTAGVGSCIEFFLKLSQGIVDWSELIFGVAAFLAGIATSIGEAFEWEKQYEMHDRAKHNYTNFVNEIRVIISSPRTSRGECELLTTKYSLQYSIIEKEAPYINQKLINEEKNNIRQQRRNSIWSVNL